MPTRRRAVIALSGAALAATVALLAPASMAQVPPLVPTTTTTTEPSSTDTTAPPSGTDFSDSSPAPEGAKDVEGDGTAAPSGGIAIPPDAQRIINAVPRSGASNNDALLDRLAVLQEMGLSKEETLRVGMGRFPIAGPARYSHDWLFPRYGPGFRFHLGTDVFAAYGTPVRAPVDGIAQSANGGLGGLTVKVFMADGTYFYLAHLSGLVDGFTSGMAVKTGDVVGYVGDSGNARGGAPHLHIGIYPRGGAPVDPKPVLDTFLYEATARVPALIEAYAAATAQPAPATEPVAAPEVPLTPLPSLLRDIESGNAAWPVEILYVASANALSGPRVLVEVAVDDIVANIDWEARAASG